MLPNFDVPRKTRHAGQPRAITATEFGSRARVGFGVAGTIYNITP
jgi:hypothetical protein